MFFTSSIGKLICLFTACTGISYCVLSQNIYLITSRFLDRGGTSNSTSPKPVALPRTNEKSEYEEILKTKVCEADGPNISGFGRGIFAMRAKISYASQYCN